MTLSSRVFGTLEGREVTLTKLDNPNGTEVEVIDYGAAIRALRLPAGASKVDVVSGFDTLEQYLAGDTFFGATVGRCANRIASGRFELGGTNYELAPNDTPHHLHGGERGFDKVVWRSRPLPEKNGVELSYRSVDGDEGYPGQVDATVVYALSARDELSIEMSAQTNAPTLVNLAHHSYFNLAGHDAGSIEDHELQLFSDAYTPGDPVVPYGRVDAVDETPFDFREPKRIGQHIDKVLGDPPGYDHNFVVRGEADQLRPVARLVDPRSGRAMDVLADQPGVQFYTGNFLDGSLSGKGCSYGFRSGLCLETQAFPNAVNVPEWRSQVLLEPGQVYTHRMVFRFQGTQPSA